MVRMESPVRFRRGLHHKPAAQAGSNARPLPCPGTSLGAILALVLLFDDPGSTPFVLTAIGLAVWVVGILVVSNVWKTPTYKMILAGDPDDLPADWEATRQRYFTINWLQLATTWATFALFLLALISL
jgi:hypothetical protein